MSKGNALRALLISSTDWVQRRVHVLDHTQPGRVQIQESLDVRIPDQEIIPGSTARIIVPIAILPKGVLWSWWATDGSGTPLSVVQHVASTQLVKSMMLEVLDAVGISAAKSGVDPEPMLEFIDNGDNSRSANAKELVETCKNHTNDQNADHMAFVHDLIRVLESSWIVLVEVPSDNKGKRMILRYGYDLQAVVAQVDINADNDSYSLPITDPGFSLSLHAEVRMPPELQVFEISLIHTRADRQQSRVLGSPVPINRVAHIQNDEFIPRLSVTELEFRLQPSDSGIRRFTDFALAAVSALVIALWLVRFDWPGNFLESDWRNHSTAAVILALPALLLSWMAKAPEPESVRRAFHRLRLVNIFLAIAMFSLATALSTLWTHWVWNIFLFIPVICCIVAITLRYLEWIHRRPSEFENGDARHD